MAMRSASISPTASPAARNSLRTGSQRDGSAPAKLSAIIAAATLMPDWASTSAGSPMAAGAARDVSTSDNPLSRSVPRAASSPRSCFKSTGMPETILPISSRNDASAAAASVRACSAAASRAVRSSISARRPDSTVSACHFCSPKAAPATTRARPATNTGMRDVAAGARASFRPRGAAPPVASADPNSGEDSGLGSALASGAPLRAVRRRGPPRPDALAPSCFSTATPSIIS